MSFSRYTLYVDRKFPTMVWTAIGSGCIGLLLGLRWRVPTLIVASLAIVMAVIVLALLAKWSLLQAAIASLPLVASLQTGYLLGLALSCARSRVGSWPGPGSGA